MVINYLFHIKCTNDVVLVCYNNSFFLLQLYSIMAKNSDVIFSTDSYQPLSIKALERMRRGTGDKLIIRGVMTKKPADWRAFLANDENKQQLINIIRKVWSADTFSAEINQRKVLLVEEGHAYMLRSDGPHVRQAEVQSLFSTQEETDTRVVLYCKYAADQGYEQVRVRSPDSDVFFILLHHAAKLNVTIIFDTGTGNHKRLINVTELAEQFTPQYCTSLLALHAFTHCDTTSAFKGIGKIKPLKIIQKNPKFQAALADLGKTWELSDELGDAMEEFTCAIYGRQRVKSTDKLRHILITEKCKSTDGEIQVDKNIELSSIPPCSRVLKQHIRRANYQTAIWRLADVAEPDVPSSTDGHGWTMHNGHLEPLWFEGDAVPPATVLDGEQIESSDDDEFVGYCHPEFYSSDETDDDD